MQKMMKRAAGIGLVILVMTGTAYAGKPLQIYLLAGQSNMEGQARASTIPSMAKDPVSKALYDKMVDETGRFRLYENVYQVYFNGGGTEPSQHGPLGVRAENTFGSDIAFGITMQELTDGPILLIRTAWGGKDLVQQFRPPSAGKFTKDKDKFGQPTGHYYHLMMRIIKSVLADPGKYHPAYNKADGYEIAGFVWFQGYNDAIKGNTPIYKATKDKPQYAEYSNLMAHFIRDVRKELNTPGLPFVIGVMGIDGVTDGPFQKAQAETAEMAEFKGNVAAVLTGKYWDHGLTEGLGQDLTWQGQYAKGPYNRNADGSLDARLASRIGWEPVGKPAPEERLWRFTTFQLDPETYYRPLEPGEAGDERAFTDEVPEHLKGWYQPDFDDSKWRQGLAPVGKGEWKLKNVSDWGAGNMLLMRTTFEVENLDYKELRLSILNRQSHHIYLNGQKIRDYVWDYKRPDYRPVEMTETLTKHLKNGTNTLAIYSRLHDAGFNSVDVIIDGRTEAGKAREARLRDEVYPPKYQEIARGRSNGEYHYFGSAKIYSRIGEAFAKAMVDLSATADGQK